MGQGLGSWRETTAGLQGRREEPQPASSGQNPRLLLIPADRLLPVPPENPAEELAARKTADSPKSGTPRGTEPPDRNIRRGKT